MTTPSKAQPWVVWIIAALFPMFQFMLQGAPSVMLPSLTKDLSITYTQAGFITTYFFYTYIIMQVPVGILADIFGPRILLTIGMLLTALACLAFSYSNMLWMAKVSRMTMGMMCSVGFVSTLCIIARWFEAKRFAFVVGLTETLAMAGAASATVGLSAAVERYGWRHAIFLCAIAGFIISLLSVFFVRNKAEDPKWISQNFHNFSFRAEAHNLWIVLKRPQVWICGIFTGLAFSVIPALFALWGIPFLIKKYQIHATLAAALIAIGYLGAGFGGPFAGWLSDYIKKRKIILLTGSFFSALCSIVLIFIDVPFTYVYPLIFLLGFTCSSYILAFAVVKEILPTQVKGKAIGFINMLCLLIGAPVLQPLIGHGIKCEEAILTTFQMALIPVPVALLLAFTLAFFIQETYCQDLTESTTA